MPLDATANFVRGETDSSTDSIQTTVSVVDASIFPDPGTQGEYNVVIWDVADYPRPDQDPDVEILRVTAIDTTADDLTVTRGQEGTSGESHPLGSAVHLSPTAKMFGDIESTFNDFYDNTAQELTADVNNTSVSTTSLDTGNINNRVNVVQEYPNAGDLGEALNSARAEYGLDNNVFVVSPGQHTISTTVDYSGQQGASHKLDLSGTTITVKANIGIDITGTGRGNLTIEGGTIDSEQADAPDMAILQARATDSPTIFIEYRNVTFNGWWGIAPLVNIASEACSYYNCEFNNANPDGWCLSATNSNIPGVTSPNNSVNDGEAPMSTNAFHRCGFRHKVSDGESTTGVIRFDGIQEWKFDSCYPNSTDGSDTILYSPCVEAQGTKSLLFDSLMVDTGGDLLVFDNNTGTTVRHSAISLRGGRYSIGGQFINCIGSDTTEINDSDIAFSTPGYVPPSNQPLDVTADAIFNSRIDTNWLGGSVNVTDFKKNLVRGSVDDVSISGFESGNIGFDPSIPRLETTDIRLVSPDGTKYKLFVQDDGTLQTGSL